MERISVIPDSRPQDTKLSFNNLFAFLSSLDYLAFLEREGAFRDLDQTYLYYMQEKTYMWIFILREYLKWVSFSYLLISISLSIILKINFVLSTIASAFFYGFFSLWIVHRYLWGNGYLYRVLKDFLWGSFLLSLFLWIGMEVLMFTLLPELWEKFEYWLFSEKDPSFFTDILYPPALYLYEYLTDFSSRFGIFQDLLKTFFITLPIKVFAFLVPIGYLYYLRRHRSSSKSYLMYLIQKVPD